MKTLRKENRLLQLAYWPNNPPPETSACQVAGLLVAQGMWAFIVPIVAVVLSPVLLAEWIGRKRASRSDPEEHRRKPESALRLCPWKIRVAGARNASKCENQRCPCSRPPEHSKGLGWFENFHCPQCGQVRAYSPRRGLQNPCISCE